VFFSLILVCGVAEQIRWNAPAIDRRAVDSASDRLAALISDADVVYFRREAQAGESTTPFDAATMWAGLKANTAVVNGYSSREPRNYLDPKENASLEEVLRYLGPAWSGRLLIVDMGPPAARTWHRVAAGGTPASRAVVIRKE
jgi:hypothetical protein